MRPIDKIRQNLDSDLSKYHEANICSIEDDNDIKSIAGVGLMAIVTPLNKLRAADVDLTRPGDQQNKDENSFPVLIINRPDRWFERQISSKYYVMVISTVQDKKSLSAGVLVPISAITNVSLLREIDDIATVDMNGVPLQSMTREYIVGGE